MMFLELTKMNDQRIAIRACDVISVEEDTRVAYDENIRADVTLPATMVTYRIANHSNTEYVKEDYHDVMSKLR